MKVGILLIQLINYNTLAKYISRETIKQCVRIIRSGDVKRDGVQKTKFGNREREKLEYVFNMGKYFAFGTKSSEVTDNTG